MEISYRKNNIYIIIHIKAFFPTHSPKQTRPHPSTFTMFALAFGGNGGNGNAGGGFPFFGGQPLGAASAPRTFNRSLRAFPYIMHPSGNQEHNENGDKIFLPATALEELVRQNIQYPMLFQLLNQSTQRNTHCGVLEFSAEEGKMYMPYWMMNNLLLSPGDIITIASVSLPKATYTKLQPQENSFLTISNPKAVLEHELRKFSCLTKGDQITITYDNQKYNIEVKDLKPANACSIIETDCHIDFEDPPNYWAEEMTTSSSSASSSSGGSAATRKGGGASGGDTNQIAACVDHGTFFFICKLVLCGAMRVLDRARPRRNNGPPLSSSSSSSSSSSLLSSPPHRSLLLHGPYGHLNGVARVVRRIVDSVWIKAALSEFEGGPLVSVGQTAAMARTLGEVVLAMQVSTAHAVCS